MRRFASLGIACAVVAAIALVGLTDVASAEETLVVEPYSHLDKRLEFTSFGQYQYQYEVARSQGGSCYLLTMDDINYQLFAAGQPYVNNGYMSIGQSGSGGGSLGSLPGVVHFVFVNDGSGTLEITFEGGFEPTPGIDIILVVVALVVVGFVIVTILRSGRRRDDRPMLSNDPYLAKTTIYRQFSPPRQLVYLALFLAVAFSYCVAIFAPLNGLSTLELISHTSLGVLALIAAGALSFVTGLFILKRTAAELGARREFRSFLMQFTKIALVLEAALVAYKLFFPSLLTASFGMTGSTGLSVLFITVVVALTVLMVLGGVVIEKERYWPLAIAALATALVVNPVLGIPAVLALAYVIVPWSSRIGREASS